MSGQQFLVKAECSKTLIISFFDVCDAAVGFWSRWDTSEEHDDLFLFGTRGTRMADIFDTPLIKKTPSSRVGVSNTALNNPTQRGTMAHPTPPQY